MSDTAKKRVKVGFVRSFGRTAKRMSVQEQNELEGKLAPHTLGKLSKAPSLFKQQGPLTVELGVGRGEQILACAEDHPDHRFIACEVFKNGLRYLLRKVEENNLENLRIYPDDARALVSGLPAKSVDKLLVLYPDPWPKNKHKKRRLVNQTLLAGAERILKDEGELIIVTDIVDYAMWTLHTVYAEGSFFPVATSPAQWATPPAGWHTTGYERKAKKEGRSPFYLTFKKQAQLEKQNHNKGETTARD